MDSFHAYKSSTHRNTFREFQLLDLVRTKAYLIYGVLKYGVLKCMGYKGSTILCIKNEFSATENEKRIVYNKKTA